MTHQRQAEIGLGVAEGPEEHPVVFATVRRQMLEQFRRIRAVLAKPVFLLGLRRFPPLRDLARFREAANGSPARHRKAKHADAVGR